MPVIPYPPDLSLERQLFWTRSHMLFPDSQETALTYFVRNLVGSELNDVEPNEIIRLPIEWVRALAFGAGVNELIALENQRARAGTTAGLVLVLVYVMAAGQYSRPSVNKAAHIIEEISKRKKEQQVQFGHFSGHKEIYRAWTLMRNSAHYWAALEWIFGPYGSDVLTRVPRGEQSQREFLRIACSFRKFGCDFRETHTKAKDTLLDPENSLRLPDDFEREAYPAGRAPVPEWIEDILKEYRAPKSI